MSKPSDTAMSNLKRLVGEFWATASSLRRASAREADAPSSDPTKSTHRGGSLADGTVICGTVQCPWHGSQFDVVSGAVKAGPAKGKIQTYETAVRDGQVFLTVPR